jgi:GNAT superfamily N-acetyltransferase
MTFSVRPANLDDLEVLVAFTLAEAREAENIQLSSDRVSDGVMAGLENPALASYWVLETAEAEVLGNISVVKEWSDWHGAYYWWIQSMFIKAAYRGQGLMSLLVEVVRTEATRENVLELRLYVHRANERAIKAYCRQGFVNLPYQIMSMKP